MRNEKNNQFPMIAMALTVTSYHTRQRVFNLDQTLGLDSFNLSIHLSGTHILLLATFFYETYCR